jgi:hypothetical protein
VAAGRAVAGSEAGAASAAGARSVARRVASAAAPALVGSVVARAGSAGPRVGFGGRAGGFGGGGDGVSTAVISYVDAHGGGTIGVESQSSAATAILTNNANGAGLGGFSGRESSVTASWIAQEVKAGRLRWIIGGGSGFGAPGDTRTGSEAAFAIVEKACPSVTVDGTKLYDCAGRASASAIIQAAQVSAAAAER